ncbi:MAG: hypothetical protein IKT60_02430 [Clostridia bacterium]|nr:hypothetical protein [Clostridia bacterium]
MYNYKDLNAAAIADPKALCRASEEGYFRQISEIADGISAHLETSRIALLCGPSSAGKTTTAGNITCALAEKGIPCHVISLDDYYLDIHEDYPKNPDGTLDFESPYCLDIALLKEHFRAIEQGEPLTIPHFSFTERRRSDKTTVIDPDDGVVLYEGIHALNPTVMGGEIEKAFGIYIHIGSEIYDGEQLLLPKNYMRLCRRIVRDRRSRGTPTERTIGMWPSVRAGEHKYILPGKPLADYVLNSFHPCEPGLFRPLIFSALDGVDHPLADALREAYGRFEEISPAYVADTSLLREFIGDLK